jgi:hypothetical protein
MTQAASTDWTGWIYPRMDEYRVVCCDCGAEHQVEFKVVNGGVTFRAKRIEKGAGVAPTVTQKK